MGSERVRPRERILRLGDVAAAQADLTDAVKRQAGRRGNEARQLHRRLLRLGLGLQPPSAELLDLGPIQPAHAGVAGDALPLAPAVLGIGPFGGPSPLAEVGACPDRRAADAPGRLRLELAADGGDACLIDHRHALGHFATGDEGEAMLGLRHRGEIAVAQPSRDVLGLDRLGQRQLEVSGERRPEPLRDRQPPVAGVLRDAGEQAIRPLQPGAGHRVAAAVEVVAGQLDGHHRRGLRLARPHRGRVRALAQLDRLLQPPVPPRRVREGVEVARDKPPWASASVSFSSASPQACRPNAARPCSANEGSGPGRCVSARFARHGAILARAGKRISALSSGRDDVSRGTPCRRATRGTRPMAAAPAAAAAGPMSPRARSSRGRSRTPRGCGG